MVPLIQLDLTIDVTAESGFRKTEKQPYIGSFRDPRGLLDGYYTEPYWSSCSHPDRSQTVWYEAVWRSHARGAEATLGTMAEHSQGETEPNIKSLNKRTVLHLVRRKG